VLPLGPFTTLSSGTHPFYHRLPRFTSGGFVAERDTDIGGFLRGKPAGQESFVRNVV
jgi:hypothetical protein